MNVKTGVDLSVHNESVDLSKKKPDFAILRLGFGDNITRQDDGQFIANVKKCESLGIPWGAYIYSYANTVAHIESEVEHCKRLLKGLKPLYPIYFDAEDDVLKSVGKLKITSFISLFCEEMKDSGYLAGFYTNKNWRLNYVDFSKLTQYPLWYARPFVNEPEIYAPMWQKSVSSWTGCNTASGVCDINDCKVDYPTIIKSQGLNGWTKTTSIEVGSKPEFYIAKRHDTMWGISVKFSTNIETLARLNPSIADISKIYAGTKVRVK